MKTMRETESQSVEQNKNEQEIQSATEECTRGALQMK